MQDSIQKLLASNVKPIYFILAGVGYSFADWACVPGISKILYGVNLLYSEELLRHYIGNKKCCSTDCVEVLAAAAKRTTNNYVAITGAITSTRWRRGNNEFYYVGSIEGKMFSGHVILDKMTEAQHTDSSYTDIVTMRAYEENIIRNTIEWKILQALGIDTDVNQQ